MRGRAGADVEFERMFAGARAAGDPDLAVAADRRIGVDAVDAVGDAVAQVGEFDRAVGHRQMVDGGRVVVRLAAGRGLPQGRVERTGAFAQQRHVHDRADDHEIGHLRMAGPDARKRHVGLNAVDGQPVGAIAVLGVLQRDVVHGHAQRRPQPDPGRTGNAQPITGGGLDPGLDRRRQEAGGHPDDQQQNGEDDHGGDGAAGDFPGSHDDIPDRADGIECGPSCRDAPFPQVYPGNRNWLKAAENNPGWSQSYVTYDTLPGKPILKTTVL